MAQKVKVTDASGASQTIQTTTVAVTEIRDVAPDQSHSVVIIDSTGVATTYEFIGGRSKRG